MRIEPGRLVQQSCSHCGEREYRAFGECVSARGDLAFYAFGRTLGHDEVLGRMAVGIGAGNPGGGSFHMYVRVQRADRAARGEPWQRSPLR